MSTMSVSSFTVRVGQLLPDVKLPAIDGSTEIPLRSDRGETTVIVWRHQFDCDRCDLYLQSLAETAEEFRVWEARLVVIASSPTRRAEPPFAALALPDRLLFEGAGVMAADRYGQVFYVEQATPDHTLPSARDLVEWLKYLGTLCPE